MGSCRISSVFLVILKIFHVILALVLMAVSIWYFLDIQGVTSLRNSNHYRLNYRVYWPQIIPWVCVVVSLLVIVISCCGFISAKVKSRGFVAVYIFFEVIAVLALTTVTVAATVWVDTDSTDVFIKDAMWDAFSRMQTDRDVEKAYGNIEKKFQCCGSQQPRDYVGHSHRQQFPTSCCDTGTQQWNSVFPKECSFFDEAANGRPGCGTVVATHARILIEILSGISAFTAFIGLINIIIAIMVFKSLKSKGKSQKVYIEHEAENKKSLA